MNSSTHEPSRASQVSPPANAPPSTALETALAYARFGWRVFPVDPANKAPLAKNGFKSASTDETRIKAWWSSNPRAMIGIATGEVVVLDVDLSKGLDVDNARHSAFIDLC